MYNSTLHYIPHTYKQVHKINVLRHNMYNNTLNYIPHAYKQVYTIILST